MSSELSPPEADDAPAQVTLPSRFLFNFSLPCRYAKKLQRGKTFQLDESFQLPDLAQLEGQPGWADVRVAWHEQGLAVEVHSRGKVRPVWCREARMVESDGLRLWFNTRPSGDVRRATRFCQHFVILPQGRGRMGHDPVVGQLLINRAKEQAPVAAEGLVTASSQTRGGDYTLRVFFDAAALNGYAPGEVSTLGFCYQLIDSELGPQSFSNSPSFPIQEDPSLWATLEFTRD